MDKSGTSIAFVLSLYGIIGHVNSLCGVDDSFQGFGQKAYQVQTIAESNWESKGICEAKGSGEICITATLSILQYQMAEGSHYLHFSFDQASIPFTGCFMRI